MGCVDLPTIKSSDGFEGIVIDGQTAKPIGGILIVGTIWTELADWSNSGGGGGPHPLAEDYAISDANGRFSFPSFSGIAGPAVYSLGLTRTINGPTFNLMAPGYQGQGSAINHPNRNQFVVMPDAPWKFVDFQEYLEGEKRLSFREEDYPALLQLLEAWHQATEKAFRKSDKVEELYQRYKKQFESR